MKSSFAKLARARHQIDEANELSTDFFNRAENQVGLSAILDPSDGHHVLRISSVPNTDEFYLQLSVVVGDAVHNLRSALDHLVYHLAIIDCGGQPKFPRNMQFPICGTREQFERQNHLDELSDHHIAQIDSYQPYQGQAGRPDSYSGPYVHQLTLLNQMSNQDKHRQLNAALAIPSGARFAFFPGVRVERQPPIGTPSELQNYMEKHSPFRNSERRLEVGAEVMREKLLGNEIPDIMPDIGTATPHVVLDEYRPLGPTLNRICENVVLILNEFNVDMP